MAYRLHASDAHLQRQAGLPMTVLHVKVAEPMADMLGRARVAMEALDAGELPEPYFGIG
jgi:hypothetical protein